jgi:hypothetical protein
MGEKEEVVAKVHPKFLNAKPYRYQLGIKI